MRNCEKSKSSLISFFLHFRVLCVFRGSLSSFALFVWIRVIRGFCLGVFAPLAIGFAA